MSGDFVISASAGIFPGAASPEAFWEAIVTARVASPQSLEAIWGVPRSKYFSENPGASEKTYLDLGHCLPVPFNSKIDNNWHLAGEGRQLQCGSDVLRQLLKRVSGVAPDLKRTALLLGTSWSDASYFADDIRATVLNIFPNHPVCDPSRQLALLAESIGLSGPRMAVDTACASSLYALSSALDILEGGLADSAIIMGLNAYLPPFLYIGFSKIQALSTKGVCLPFSAEACGIIPGETVAAIFVETEEHALRSGRTPLARVAALGLSADGGERSVFAPGPMGQKLAYERAYQRVDSNEVDYIETHGTGTPLGDETEVTCLHEFFSSRGRSQGSLPIGSVKSLIGHPLAAAGLASMVKGLSILKHRMVPPHISVNPIARLADSCLRLCFTPEPIQELNRPLRVGISSLGFGGANAHVVLEDWRPREKSVLARERHRVAMTGCEMYFGDKKSTAESIEAIRGSGARTSQILHGRHTLDASALRMGPVQAARLDPFIILLAHVGKGAFQTLPPGVSPDSTAIVACCDLGAVASLQYGRKYASEFLESLSSSQRLAIQEKLGKKELSVEGITSSLPAMLSGLFAAGTRSRGFHQTCSGGPSLFWNNLMFAHQAFSNKKCQAMILTAGGQKRSPIDTTSQAPFAEGAISLALCEESLLQNAEPLIWIERAFPNEVAPADVAKSLDVVESDIVCLRVPDSKLAGFSFGENEGLNIIADLLQEKPGTIYAVHVAPAPKVAASFTLVLRRAAKPIALKPLVPEIPVDVVFQHEKPGSTDVSEPKPQPLVQTVRSHDASQVQESLRLWNEAAASAVSAVFEARSRVISSLSLYKETATPLKKTEVSRYLQRGQQNICIAITQTQPLSANLVVNERHPYFFDHPLDHVPGILLLEGGFQLAETWLQQNGRSAAECFATSLEINFKKFVEKEIATELRVEEREGRLAISCRQGEKECCQINLQYAELSDADVLSNSAPFVAHRSEQTTPAASILHKHRAENVLVSNLSQTPEKKYRVQATPIPNDHFFADGHSQWHLPLYHLETGRQMMMLLAHEVMGIPLGVPMNLIRLRLHLKKPALRAAELVLESRREKIIEAPGNVLAEIEIHFLAKEIDLGHIAITAQVADAETFLKQRRKG